MAKPTKAAQFYTKEVAGLKDESKGAPELFKTLADQAGSLRSITSDWANRFGDIVDISKQVGENNKDIFKNTINLLDIEQKLANAKNKGEREALLALKDRATFQKAYQDKANEALDSYNKKNEKAKSFVGKIPGIGSDLQNIMDKAADAYKKGLGENFDPNSPGGIKKQGMASFKAVGAAALATGLIISKKVLDAMQQTGLSIGDIFSRPEFILFGAEANAIANEFGNMDSSSVKLAASMKLTALTTGVTAENQAKILGAMAATSDASLEVLRSQMMAYKKAGVPFKAIMDDVAGNTELFAKFGKDGGANIFEAAKRAKELGVNLSDVSSITESLLNFEESIEAQMNAQVLLGRNISLDRARQLAFTGDQAGMMDEIVKQVGGEAEFNNLNVIQRKALADSVGLSVERMSALVRAEEQNAAAADKTRSKYIAMGAILGALIGLVVGGLTLGTALPAALGAMGVGALAGGAIGTGIGTMFPMADGGIVTGPTNAMVGEAGPEMVTPLPTEGVKMDTKPLENKFDQLIAMNKRLVDEIGNLQVGA
jgi:uncharacterized membrane protein